MSKDEDQVVPEVPEQSTPDTPVVEEQQEKSFEEELNEARKDDKPEEAEEEQKPESEEKPGLEESTEEAEKPKENEETKPDEDEEKPDKSKLSNAEAAAERVREREANKRVIEQSIDRAYQPQLVDELTNAFIEQGYTQFEAEMLARDERRNQQSQIQEARTQIAELNMQVETEAIQVMHEFPVFDPNSDSYDKDFAGRASALYERAADVQYDPKTNVIVSSKITPYQFYKELAEMRDSGVSQASIKAQKAAEQQLAAVAPQSSAAPMVNESAEQKQASGLERALNDVR